MSLVHHAEQGALKRIERFVRTPLAVNVIAGFEPRKSAPAGGRGRLGLAAVAVRAVAIGGGRRFGSGSGGGNGGGTGKPGGWRQQAGGGWRA